MDLKSGYKESEVGVIPNDWTTVSLGQIGESLIGLTYKPSEVRDYGTLVLRSSNIQSDALSFEDNVYVETDIPDRIMVRPGDVLVCVRNGSRDLIGKSALLDERTNGMTFGAFMAVYRSNLGELVSYLFQSSILKRQINEHLGATINQITNKSLNSFKIPLPTMASEQRAIATALSDVDAAMTGITKLIAKKNDLKLAVMQNLLSGQARLPGFSEDWQKRRLGDHVRFLRNGTHSRAQLSEDGSIKNLHYGDIHGASSVWLAPANTQMPTLDALLAARLDRLTTGDLVFVDATEDLDGVGTSVEITDVNDSEVVSGLHTIAARFDKAVLADGFKAYLQFIPAFRNQLCQLAAGTKVLATNRAHIASVEMMLPEPKEQMAIAAVLTDMDSEIAALTAQADKIRLLKQAMMQELLTGRTRLQMPEAAHG